MIGEHNNAGVDDCSRATRKGFSLVEVLIVIAILSILAGVVLPRFDRSTADQLHGAALTMAADLNYARDLAVTNNSTYRFSFQLLENRYVLHHVGTNPALHSLPAQPFDHAANDPLQHVVDFDKISQLGSIKIFAVLKVIGSSDWDDPWADVIGPHETASEVRFGPLGGTSNSTPIIIWLRGGTDSEQRFVPLRIDPITGMTSVGGLQSAEPAVP